jgi:hypothetical protein
LLAHYCKALQVFGVDALGFVLGALRGSDDGDVAFVVSLVVDGLLQWRAPVLEAADEFGAGEDGLGLDAVLGAVEERALRAACGLPRRDPGLPVR